jgi:hypothetical protein
MGGRIWITDGYSTGRAILILKQDCCDLHAALNTKSLPTATPLAATAYGLQLLTLSPLCHSLAALCNAKPSPKSQTTIHVCM